MIVNEKSLVRRSEKRTIREEGSDRQILVICDAFKFPQARYARKTF